MDRRSKIARLSQPPHERVSLGAVLPDWIPVLFLAFVFLFGGGSRSDLASLPILRGGSLLFAFWAASRMQREDWRRIRVPLVLMVVLTAWMAFQLVPLPPATWQDLPGRDIIVAIDRLLGQADLWRPISFSPSQTLNSLLAMTVPFAALLLGALVKPENYPRLMYAIVTIACFSALLGLVQILTGSSSVAYFYRITSTDSMAGLFANRNHHSFFLACAIPIIAMLLRDELMRKRKRALVRIALVFAGILLTVLTVLIGSRSGLVAGVVAFVVGYMVVAAAWNARDDGRAIARVSGSTSRFGRALFYAPPVLLVLFLGVALWQSNRTTALTRLIQEGPADDLRVSAWSTVQSMIETFWMAGSGFGSFAQVYRIFEPDSLLRPQYFNHAHNDWAEAFLTGGLPFVLIILIAILWLGRMFVASGMRNLIKGYRGDIRLPVLVAIVLLAATSFVDYPLRVPSIQVFAISLILLLCRPKSLRSRGE